jgi:hypothetical protein
MISRLTSLIILFPLYTRPQSVEPLDSLIAAIIFTNKSRRDEQIRLLRNYKEKNWLSLLPSIGYDPVTRRSLVNFSLNNFISLLQRKRELKFQVLQLTVRYRIQLISDTITCQHYYREFKELLENYAGQQVLLDSSYQLLIIKIHENKKLQATTEDVLKTKLDLERTRISIDQMRNGILIKALQLSLLINRQLEYKLPDLLNH